MLCPFTDQRPALRSTEKTFRERERERERKRKRERERKRDNEREIDKEREGDREREREKNLQISSSFRKYGWYASRYILGHSTVTIM